MSCRLSLCLNSGPKQGQAQAAVVVKTQGEALVQAAANKLRLKKKDVARVRLFVWGSGVELPRGESLAGLLRNDDMVAVSRGEPYSGPGAKCAGEQLPAETTVESPAAADGIIKWSSQSAELAVVEWSDAASMNRSLVRAAWGEEWPATHAWPRQLERASVRVRASR